MSQDRIFLLGEQNETSHENKAYDSVVSFQNLSLSCKFLNFLIFQTTVPDGRNDSLNQKASLVRQYFAAVAGNL